MVNDEIRGKSIRVDEATTNLNLSLIDRLYDKVQYSTLAITLLD